VINSSRQQEVLVYRKTSHWSYTPFQSVVIEQVAQPLVLSDWWSPASRLDDNECVIMLVKGDDEIKRTRRMYGVAAYWQKQTSRATRVNYMLLVCSSFVMTTFSTITDRREWRRHRCSQNSRSKNCVKCQYFSQITRLWTQSVWLPGEDCPIEVRE